jgi:hypothetical protein
LGNDTWVVGAEYDTASFKKLKVALHALGYHIGSESFGVGGSQAISTWHVSGPAGALVVESETYVGLTVRGPKELVAQVKESVLRGADF